MPKGDPCAVDGCERACRSGVLCTTHYSRLYRTGGLGTTRPGIGLPEGMKWCCGCQAALAVDQFTPRNTMCKRCKADMRADWRKRQPPRSPWMPMSCEVCGVVFVGDRKNRRFCSKPCLRAGTDVSALYRARKANATIELFDHLTVFERDGWMCGLCDLPIDRSLRWPHRASASLDHRVPLVRGGEHSMVNSQAAHLGCNASKGARLDEVNYCG